MTGGGCLAFVLNTGPAQPNSVRTEEARFSRAVSKGVRSVSKGERDGKPGEKKGY